MATDPTVAAKAKIEESLKAFKSGALAKLASTFFESLGYISDKNQPLESNTVGGLLELANQGNFLNPAKAHADEWKSVDFLFQLTDEEVRNYGQTSLEFDSTIDVRSDKHIESYIFFAVELKKNSYTRTELADITREINRLFPMPAMVLFKHCEALTLSIINRRVHKRDVARDVLEKVTLIKDINISNPHRGHLEILYDLALPQLIAEHEVSNFVQLDEAWRKTLDTSLLNKRFYKELANWYFWALQHVEFPRQVGVTDDVNRATNVIRLITRLIFVWFLKERELVPDALFDRASLGELLKDLSPDKSTFYKAILQNLFFATLNTPMNDPNAPRMFRSETNGRFNDQYMVHNQYRYQKLFSRSEDVLEIFAGIPFLNGGLFECLDKREEVNGKLVETRIDGFSDLPKKQPTVPNKLFFGDEEQIDLNDIYGTRGKRYSVRGLIDTLNRYKFTIAENTPIEEEVALDPELLGKVFENLLASYNPETGATARKQTGSFYTPREIVNYMVDESLIAYLETQLTSDSEDKDSDNLNKRLRQLFAYTDEPHEFSGDEVDELITAIDAVKILDPACGSGAFPMGILQRLVFVLSKLDPNNAKWEQRQIERVREAMRVAERIEDHKFRENTLNDLRAQIANIEEAFARNELDYGRKLFLIENCIYGVDIQPIAIQIAKLRFFISLIIDQRIRPQADNLGVRPLPNLETKFLAANFLLDLEKPAQSLLRNTAIDEKERELKIVRERYFTARTTRTKDKYRKEDERIRREIVTLLKSEGDFPHETTEKLIAWNPYDQNASAEFFDSEWMFGVVEGFEMLLTNPPYLKERDNKAVFETVNRSRLGRLYHEGKMDFWYYFLHAAIDHTTDNGVITFITSRYWIASSGSKKLIRRIKDNISFKKIVDIGSIKVFETVAGHHMIHSYQKRRHAYPVEVRTVENSIEDIASVIETPNLRINQLTNGEIFSSQNEIKLLKSEVRVRESEELGSLYFVTQGVVQNPDRVSSVAAHKFGLSLGHGVFVLSKAELKALRLTNIETNFVKQFLSASCVHRYIVDGSNPEYLLYITRDNCSSLAKYPNIKSHLKRFRRIMEARRETINGTVDWFQLHWPRKPEYFEQPKIVLPSMFKYPVAALCDDEFYFGISTNIINKVHASYPLEYLLALINSRFGAWWFRHNGKQRGIGLDIGVEKLRTFPVRPLPDAPESSIVSLIRRIVESKKRDSAANTSSFEDEIDRIIYGLYEFTDQEIDVITRTARTMEN